MIPFHRPMNLMLSEKIAGDFKEILQTRRYTGGKHLEKFEEFLGSLFGVRYVLGCGSGTMALVIAIKGLGRIVNPGYRPQVTLPAFGFRALRDAVYFAKGDVHHYCDIHPCTWLPDFKDKDRKNQILLNVHTFGNTSLNPDVPYDGIIHDASHAWGLCFADIPIGNVTILSMASSKDVTAMEGGVILTDDTELYQICKEYRDLWSRMNESQALVGYWYAYYSKAIHLANREIWKFYEKKTRYYGQAQAIPYQHSYNYFGLRVTNSRWREQIIKNAKNKVDLRFFYQCPFNFAHPVSKELGEQIIHLPIYHGVPKEKVIEILFEGEIDSEFDRETC